MGGAVARLANRVRIYAAVSLPLPKYRLQGPRLRAIARIEYLADGFSGTDPTDAIARQIQLRKSLGRKPPV